MIPCSDVRDATLSVPNPRPTQPAEVTHDPPLHPARDGPHLDAGAALPDLARRRARRLRGDGAARRGARRRLRDAAARVRRLRVRGRRRRAHRRDREDRQARRHRLPHLRRGEGRRRRAPPAQGHDVLGRARHDARRPAQGRDGAAPRGRGPRPRGGEEARRRAPADADDGAQPRHPRRADHLRAEARRLVRRLAAQARGARVRGADGGGREDLRRGRHLRERRPARRGASSWRSSASRARRARRPRS